MTASSLLPLTMLMTLAWYVELNCHHHPFAKINQYTGSIRMAVVAQAISLAHARVDADMNTRSFLLLTVLKTPVWYVNSIAHRFVC